MSGEDAGETSWQFGAAIFAFYAVVVVGSCLSCCCLIACVRAIRKARREPSDSTRPQHDLSGQLRVDAAFRDAQDGYRQCPVCGFENFKRFPSCALCGTPLDAKTDVRSERASAEPRHLAHRENGYAELREAPASDDAQGAAAGVRGSTLTQAATERQRRARTRKEWTRRADVHGHLFWFRDDNVDADTRFPGCTLTLSAIQQPALQLDQTQWQSQDQSVELELIVEVPPAPLSAAPDADSARFLSKQEVMRSLELETQPLTLTLTLADVSSPAQMPVSVVASPEPTHAASDQQQSLPWPDVLQLAAQDFPTKYAHFVARTSAMLGTAHTIAARVVRLSLLDDSLQFLSFVRRRDARSLLRVSFADETGIDAGGLKREWFEALAQQLADPAAGVFACVNQAEQTYTLAAGARVSASAAQRHSGDNSDGDGSSDTVVNSEHLLYCFGAGRLVGRALLEGQVLGFHLARPLLKVMLGQPVSFSDLAFVDRELHASTQWLLAHDGVDALGLTFSVVEQRADGRHVEVELVANGRDVTVTDANKLAFLERRFQYLLFERVASEHYAFLKGLYDVVPLELLAIFDPEELDYVLSGVDAIHVDDWETHTRYEGRFVDDSSRNATSSERRQLEFQRRAVRWFWEIVRAMPDEYRRRLLHFATGSVRAPIAGFSALTSHDGHLCPFTLYSVEVADSEYISSHACFNRVGLPRYASKAKLELVLYATLDTELYGFTTA